MYGFVIPTILYAEILKKCLSSGNNETGGIIIGNYSEDLHYAMAKMILGPSPDSKSGSNWFYRGVLGFQLILNSLWYRQKQYYIGEWHYHPFGEAKPSRTDINQMLSIASTKQYNCPEPILIIVGGDIKINTIITVMVFYKNQSYLSLKLI
jgi:integrative and conjugative element protein (TIGR02256 family)